MGNPDSSSTSTRGRNLQTVTRGSARTNPLNLNRSIIITPDDSDEDQESTVIPRTQGSSQQGRTNTLNPLATGLSTWRYLLDSHTVRRQWHAYAQRVRDVALMRIQNDLTSTRTTESTNQEDPDISTDETLTDNDEDIEIRESISTNNDEGDDVLFSPTSRRRRPPSAHPRSRSAAVRRRLESSYKPQPMNLQTYLNNVDSLDRNYSLSLYISKRQYQQRRFE
jgi:hypothetical protein